MFEAASVLSFFVAFALLHGAAPNRFPLKRDKGSRAVFACMRAGAALAAGSGVLLWSRAQDATAALLVAVAALSVIATMFVLLAPLFPRAIWASALACPLLIAAFVLMGGGRG